MLLNIRQPFKRYDYPIYWFGKVKDSESIDYLEDMYNYSRDSKMREQAVNAIGCHESKDIVYPFLKNVFENERREKVVKSAVFWMGNIHTKRALTTLEEYFDKFRSYQLKDAVIFALHNHKSAEADKLLIQIAKSRDESSKVRKQAIFWLAQRATKVALGTLEDISKSSREKSIQEQTVFAISQFPNEESIPTLIKIAKNNPYKHVRKQAIFWLSQKNDPRVISFLEDILLDR